MYQFINWIWNVIISRSESFRRLDICLRDKGVDRFLRIKVNEWVDAGLKIAIIGTDKKSIWLYKLLKKNAPDLLVGIMNSEKLCNIPNECVWGGDATQLLSFDLEDLLYEETDNLRICICDLNNAIKYKGLLIDLGIKEDNIYISGQKFENGTAARDVYDVQLGYSRESDYPGFVVFDNEKIDAPLFTIVTLGGSTSDPTLYNIISWSEYLFESIRNYDLHIKVLCGGMGSHVVTQESLKLIRDGLLFKPNIVISYSGVNDATNFVYEKNHPFVLEYQKDMIEKSIRGKKVCNTLVQSRKRVKIKSVTCGVQDSCGIGNHWIRCERMMHAVCSDLGIEFYGILQPYSQYRLGKELPNKAREVEEFYSDIKDTMAKENWNWLLDFTSIFDQDQSVFIDWCHVYEKGNRIISKKLLPYVFREMEKTK